MSGQSLSCGQCPLTSVYQSNVPDNLVLTTLNKPVHWLSLFLLLLSGLDSFFDHFNEFRNAVEFSFFQHAFLDQILVQNDVPMSEEV